MDMPTAVHQLVYLNIKFILILSKMLCFHFLFSHIKIYDKFSLQKNYIFLL